MSESNNFSQAFQRAQHVHAALREAIVKNPDSAVDPVEIARTMRDGGASPVELLIEIVTAAVEAGVALIVPVPQADGYAPEAPDTTAPLGGLPLASV